MRLLGRGVRCVRGGREVFSGLDFEASAGEALAVTGPNGSGKTSLLRLIAGLLVITEGKIGLEGGEAELTLPEQAHYLGHRDALKPALSVMENLVLYGRYFDIPRAECRRVAEIIAPSGQIVAQALTTGDELVDASSGFDTRIDVASRLAAGS